MIGRVAAPELEARVSAAIACGVVETMRQAAKARPAKLSLVMGSYAFSRLSAFAHQ
jgi:hypothetical protein